LFTFQHGPEDWSQLGSDIDGEAYYDGSGESVSLSADGLTVAIGAPGNDGTVGVSMSSTSLEEPKSKHDPIHSLASGMNTTIKKIDFSAIPIPPMDEDNDDGFFDDEDDLDVNIHDDDDNNNNDDDDNLSDGTKSRKSINGLAASSDNNVASSPINSENNLPQDFKSNMNENDRRSEEENVQTQTKFDLSRVSIGDDNNKENDGPELVIVRSSPLYKSLNNFEKDDEEVSELEDENIEKYGWSHENDKNMDEIYFDEDGDDDDDDAKEESEQSVHQNTNEDEEQISHEHDLDDNEYEKYPAKLEEEEHEGTTISINEEIPKSMQIANEEESNGEGFRITHEPQDTSEHIETNKDPNYGHTEGPESIAKSNEDSNLHSSNYTTSTSICDINIDNEGKDEPDSIIHQDIVTVNEEDHNCDTLKHQNDSPEGLNMQTMEQNKDEVSSRKSESEQKPENEGDGILSEEQTFTVRDNQEDSNCETYDRGDIEPNGILPTMKPNQLEISNEQQSKIESLEKLLAAREDQLAAKAEQIVSMSESHERERAELLNKVRETKEEAKKTDFQIA